MARTEGETMSDIWTRRNRLDKERRDHMKLVMAEFDKEHYKKLRSLQDECSAIGHNLKFTGTGPLGDPWFVCTICGKSIVELEKPR